MLTIISPQKVKSSNGYIVQVANRYTVEYLDDHYTVTIKVDFGVTIGLDKNTLVARNKSNFEVILNQTQYQQILDRLVKGLEAMGSQVEIC
jgi:hypothetical protein